MMYPSATPLVLDALRVWSSWRHRTVEKLSSVALAFALAGTAGLATGDANAQQAFPSRTIRLLWHRLARNHIGKRVPPATASVKLKLRRAD